ncbi:hypothetical protein GCK32_004066 [Trichostrongylus colubriformis]|uniref:Uncharacterized protein n=1 Tax=Trichostrongylus colubriformis TaxID=6319 RepID=A0AAN8FQK9_TRICO
MMSGWRAAALLVVLMVIPSVAVEIPNFLMLPFNPQISCQQCIEMALGITSTAPPATSEPPEETTQNAFQRAGWETDDKGNVFIGTDDAKLLLISVGSYWPFPKDYRK